ncbi:Si-specific NAD(P)(+) transhydrogenase [Microlunatus sp. Gsoil 973]|uniref:Si-specific NAD(P)(+) transhydrogenase n=1 Tax=Microlunatus sp. Gsoil 973 TaxID=2672569 RepID=UPI0012B4F6CA|nr:Si-specific NAD(P)(+) transhydrogenase [Microlunatus sp. Gsoil 973]QGN33026.1 Si-specific NAD(P)(+) transhydrogenase [Microlunatus sp. Gsoil 973]
MEHEFDYDLAVIGSGPGGQRAAIMAAKLGKRVCVIDARTMVGGVCVNTGTIPSKTLREAVLYLTGMQLRELYGASYRVKDEITVTDLLGRLQHVIGREVEVIRSQLLRNHVELIPGVARFADEHSLDVTVDGPVQLHAAEHRTVTANKIIVAVGTMPARPSHIRFDGIRVLDSDQILSVDKVPDSLVVVGAGVIGVEYASIFAALGTRVTLVEKRPNMLDFCDPEIVESLKFHLRDQTMSFRFGEEVAQVESGERGTITTLASGKRIAAEAVMYSAGRQGNTARLDLAEAGLEADERGRLVVDEHYRTAVPHIYAVGDVIGFPALAATSMDQGRLAAAHAFDEPAHDLAALQPIGIYTIPEISFCGKTEAELTKESVPFEVGISRYRELARGQIIGDPYGMLKLVVHAETRHILGVHVFGTNATELVHIGQAIMGCGGTIDYLVDTVLNYPTLSEAYKVAALDVTNKLRAVDRLADSMLVTDRTGLVGS